MLEKMKTQARLYFFVNYLKAFPDATYEDALSFSGRCWEEFVVQTNEALVADIQGLFEGQEESLDDPEDACLSETHCRNLTSYEQQISA